MYLEEVVELREGVGWKEEKKRMDKQIANSEEDEKTERWRDIYIWNGQRPKKDKGRENGRGKREERERNRKGIRKQKRERVAL